MVTAKRVDSKQAIPIAEMRAAIRRSGYLVEQRVEPIFARMGFFVEMNPVYPDPETGKSREIDIYASSGITLYRGHEDVLLPSVICECVNNPQPIVFFVRDLINSGSFYEDVRVAGIPAKLWDGYGYDSVPSFAGMGRYHHYCGGPYATQYCTFQKKKGSSEDWMALHNDEQHEVFNSLVRYLEFDISRMFETWTLPRRLSEESVVVRLYYPLVVLQGRMFAASVKRGQIVLRESNHVQFRKEVFQRRSDSVEQYQIDVITEKYLPSYLKMVERETGKARSVFRRKKKEVWRSIARIVADIKRLKRKPKSFRKYLEY
jgi:hypothetical protein